MNIITLFACLFLVAFQHTVESASRHRDGSRRKNKLSTNSNDGKSSSSVPVHVNNTFDESTLDSNAGGNKRSKNSRGNKRRNRKNRNRQREITDTVNDNKNVLKTIARAKFITESRLLKSDWCKSQPVRQTIRTRNGCKGSVINHFCYGQCNSFYIPKDLTLDGKESDPSVDYFKSCSFCKPKSESWVSVRLKCKSHPSRKRARHITKKIKRVDGCTCVSVNNLLDSSTHQKQSAFNSGSTPIPTSPLFPSSTTLLSDIDST